MVRVQLPLRMGVLGATDIARDFIKTCGIEMTAHARQATVSAIIHVLGILIMSLSMSSARAADPLAGDRLYEDVRRFESFGPHRFGSAGATQAMAWIADELRTAGFEVRTQNFDMPRQYDFESGTLTVDGRSIPVTPHWWMPLAQASFALTAPIAPSGGDAHRKFVRLSLPFDNRAYLTAQRRQRLEAAFARGAAAVLLTIEHPSGEIYTYNVDQADTPWPLPVILVPQHERAALDAAEAAGQLLTVDIKGAYRSNVAGHNVIGRMNHGKGRTIVVSTPVTSW